MSSKTNLVGKTISGIVAVRDNESEPMGIWMMQFTDGTHVEFVSPAGRRRLKSAAKSKRQRVRKIEDEAQLALNVA